MPAAPMAHHQIASCLKAPSDSPLEEDSPVRQIAIDGKTNRRSHDRAADLGPLHIVTAWASEEGIALGQVATEAKSNEITAIPLLLEQIDLTDALVTIDAMGCQKEIASDIVEGGGDFVIALKDNQPTLREAVETYFAEHLERDLARLAAGHRRRLGVRGDDGVGRDLGKVGRQLAGKAAREFGRQFRVRRLVGGERRLELVRQPERPLGGIDVEGDQQLLHRRVSPGISSVPTSSATRSTA